MTQHNRGAKRPHKDNQAVPPKHVDQPVRQVMEFDRALAIFLSGQISAGHSKQTQNDYRCVVGLFISYIKGVRGYTCVDQVTEADILEWLTYLRGPQNKLGRPYSSRSVQTYCRDVSTFFRWLFSHKYIEVNPVEMIGEPKAETVLIRIFTDEELKLLDAACDRAAYGRSLTSDERKMLAARDRAILWLLLSTGIRLSEACGLRFCDVDWDDGTIYVMGKGGKERRIPFGSVARQHLNTYVTYWRGTPESTEEAVFITVFGQGVRPNAVKQMFARLKRESGITDKRVSAHTCRHWFAVNAIKRGMPTKVLKDILGHATWKMIEVYVQLASQDLKEVYAKFSPVDALDIHHSKQGHRERVRDWRKSRRKGGKQPEKR